MANILVGMDGVGLTRPRRETVEACQLPVHAGGDALWAPVLAFLKADGGHALERRTVEANTVNHLDRRSGARRRLGPVCVLAGYSRFIEELKHDVGMAPFAANFLLEVLHDD